MSMSDLTPSSYLSLSHRLPCITHRFLSSCNMTRDSENSEEVPITAAGATREIAIGTPQHPRLFFLSLRS